MKERARETKKERQRGILSVGGRRRPRSKREASLFGRAFDVEH